MNKFLAVVCLAAGAMAEADADPYYAAYGYGLAGYAGYPYAGAYGAYPYAPSHRYHSNFFLSQMTVRRPVKMMREPRRIWNIEAETHNNPKYIIPVAQQSQQAGIMKRYPCFGF